MILLFHNFLHFAKLLNKKYGTHTESRILHLHKIFYSAYKQDYDFPEEQAFYNCNSLISIKLPKAISIGGFSSCDSLLEIELPQAKNVYGFQNCNKLKTLKLPKAEIIDDTSSSGGFSFCDDLESINLPQATSVSGFVHCPKLKSVTLPVVQFIHDSFNYCDELNSIILPDSLERVEQSFNNCPSLKSVYCKSSNPSNIYLSSSFRINYVGHTKATLYVPIGTLDAYKNWNYYFTNINIEEYDYEE